MSDTTENYEARFWTALDDHRTGMLGLKDAREGHSQPMTAHFAEEGPLWFFTHADAQLPERATQPQAGLFHYASGDHGLHACVHGELVVDRDQTVIDRFWSSEVERWLPEGKDSPRVTLLRFTPDDGQVWLSEHGPKVFGFRFGGGSAPKDERSNVDFKG